MSSPKATSSRSRGWCVRWLRRAGFAMLVVVCALGVTVWRLGWWAPPTYTPGPGIEVRGTGLDSAGHDARVVLLGDEPYVLHVESTVAPAGDGASGPKAADGRAARGALLFFGSRHSKDPDHPQIAELRHAWEKFRPTVALVEGRMSFFVGTTRQGIGIFGEGAPVYSMADRAGLPCYTLEPPLEEEIAALDECGDRTQVAMFRVLSGYVSARRGGPVSTFKVGRLLGRRARPLTDAFPTIEAFDAYYAQQFPGAGDWREIPEEAMWPGKEDTILHRMATRSNRVRDEHFVRTMLDLVRRGERVFAIAGRSHTVNFEPVLWESMQPAERGGLSSARPWEAE